MLYWDHARGWGAIIGFRFCCVDQSWETQLGFADLLFTLVSLTRKLWKSDFEVIKIYPVSSNISRQSTIYDCIFFRRGVKTDDELNSSATKSQPCWKSDKHPDHLLILHPGRHLPRILWGKPGSERAVEKRKSSLVLGRGGEERRWSHRELFLQLPDFLHLVQQSDTNQPYGVLGVGSSVPSLLH